MNGPDFFKHPIQRASKFLRHSSSSPKSFSPSSFPGFTAPKNFELAPNFPTAQVRSQHSKSVSVTASGSTLHVSHNRRRNSALSTNSQPSALLTSSTDSLLLAVSRCSLRWFQQSSSPLWRNNRYRLCRCRTRAHARAGHVARDASSKNHNLLHSEAAGECWSKIRNAQKVTTGHSRPRKPLTCLRAFRTWESLSSVQNLSSGSM